VAQFGWRAKADGAIRWECMRRSDGPELGTARLLLETRASACGPSGTISRITRSTSTAGSNLATHFWAREHSARVLKMIGPSGASWKPPGLLSDVRRRREADEGLPRAMQAGRSISGKTRGCQPFRVMPNRTAAIDTRFAADPEAFTS